jgi:hypothetical protein
MFIGEYENGMLPTQIFRKYGFDENILESKRIQMASSRWRESK